MGSVTDSGIKWILKDLISTHTLRGERDMTATQKKELLAISTHTLRGERDHRHLKVAISIINFNSHAPWGA